jgi:hypothetical protein
MGYVRGFTEREESGCHTTEKDVNKGGWKDMWLSSYPQECNTIQAALTSNLASPHSRSGDRFPIYFYRKRKKKIRDNERPRQVDEKVVHLPSQEKPCRR